MSKLASYRFVHSHPTLAETIQRHIPGGEALTEAQCVALIDEAKQAASDDVANGSIGDRAKWMAKFIRARLKAEKVVK